MKVIWEVYGTKHLYRKKAGVDEFPTCIHLVSSTSFYTYTPKNALLTTLRRVRTALLWSSWSCPYLCQQVSRIFLKNNPNRKSCWPTVPLDTLQRLLERKDSTSVSALTHTTSSVSTRCCHVLVLIDCKRACVEPLESRTARSLV
jgi:hypothetical protein